MMAQRVAAMFDELRDQVVAMVQDYDHQGSQITELQGQLAAQTQRVEALEAELQGLRQLLGQDAEESEAETCTPPSPNMVDSPTSGSDEEMEPNRRVIANSLLKHLYALVGAKDKEKKEVEALPQVQEAPDGHGPKPTHWRCVWRPGMDVRSERTVQRKGVVGFLSCGECFDVIQEWRGREGTLFLKLAGDKGWVFDKTRTGTFCVPVGSEWQDWRGPEGHKAWTANNRDQHGSWNNAPGGNGRDRGGDKWKWAWDDNDRGWGSSKQSSSSWKGQEDKWAWHEQDRDAWSGKEWKSWGYNGQNKTESHKNSW